VRLSRTSIADDDYHFLVRVRRHKPSGCWMLNNEQRAELEALGPETVRIKLMQGGADKGAAVPGFTTGPYRSLTRSDIEDWLAEKNTERLSVQHRTLRWAIIAGWAGITGVLVGIAAIIVMVWLAKRMLFPTSPAACGAGLAV
jgi:hypothetical protein